MTPTAKPKFLIAGHALPVTKDEALAILREFIAAGLTWSFDDAANDIITGVHGERTFTDEEAARCEFLIDRLNELFGADAEKPYLINAGAWHAADLVDWDGTGQNAEEADQ